MKNTHKGFAMPLIIALVALIAIGGGVYIYNQNNSETPRFDDFENEYRSTIDINDVDDQNNADTPPVTPPATTPVTAPVTPPVTVTPAEPVFCTADAFQCPDGSWVGRTGPNCEFVCPQTKSQIFLEGMSEDLKINKPAVSLSVYSYSGFGFGNGWPVQDVHAKYIQAKLPNALGMYATETGMGYSNGEIVCVIQGIRQSTAGEAPVTTHSELVCMDME